ncbi:MAG TPA: CBS domain-containing protein [Methanomicrobiales archaeon]|nr:CBS domain-containing protein [Methanomicrobiales archaeon]
MIIRDVMSKPITIAKSAFITEALDKMLDEGVDPLIVTQNGDAIGMISRKSIARKLGRKQASNISASSIHVANSLEHDFTSAYLDQNIDVLIPLLQVYKMVAVLDEEHRLVGQVTAGDLLRVVEPVGSVQDVLTPACTIQSDERVVHLRRRMLDDDIDKFVVVDGGEIIGIVTETDVANAMRAFKEVVEEKYQDHRIRNLIVRDIMSTPILTADVEVGISPIVELMLSKNISTLPVTDHGKLIGMVTRESLIKAL